MRRTLLHRLLIVLLMAALLPALVPTAAGALVCGPGEIEWLVSDGDGTTLTDRFNWEGQEVPGPGDIACIGDEITPPSFVEVPTTETFSVAALRSSSSVNVQTDASLLLGGDSIVEGGLNNSEGTVRPGPTGGVLDVTDYYQQEGLLQIDIAGDTPGTDGYSQIAVSGPESSATFYGASISVALAPGHTPADQQRFPVVIASSVSSFTLGEVPADPTLIDSDPDDLVTWALEIVEDPQGDDRLDLIASVEDPPPPPPPAFTVDLDDVEVDEGDEGTNEVEVTATVTADPPDTPRDFDIDLTIEIIGLNAEEGTDFQGAQTFQQINTTMKIPPGQTTASIALDVIGNDRPEPDKVVEATILTASPEGSVAIGRDTATITILNDDPAPSINDPSIVPDAFPDTCLVDTDGMGIAKTDALSTAQIALQTVTCSAPEGVGTVLIGRDDDFADSLSSGFLQGEAPLLLVPGSGPVPPDVLATIRQLSPSRIIILGGVDAISPAVETELVALGVGVVRRDGPTRIETAIDVASTDAADASTAIIARAFPGQGDTTQAFADSIAAGGMAADLGYPVLLTETDRLTTNTATYLRTSPITDVFIMGGTAAVSAATEAEIADIIPGSVFRVADDNRAGTAIEVAKARGTQTAADVAQLILVEGQADFAWASGLTAAFQAARDDAPIVLLNGGDVPAETAAFLTPNADGAGMASFAVATEDVGEDVLTCAGLSVGCQEARRLLGLDGTIVTFDPPSLSPAVAGAAIDVSFSGPLPGEAVVTYDGSCLTGPTDDPAAVAIRSDLDGVGPGLGGLPLPCLVTVTIEYTSGVTQTSTAAYVEG